MSNVTLHWILGHLGLIGNNKADKLAKVATRLESAEPLLRDGRL
jgi:ribonuclease HI